MHNLLYVFLILMGCTAHAQITIEGTVKNKEQHFVPYCSIGIKGTQVGAITNDKGYYKLLIPNHLMEKEIVFSSIGYADQYLPVKELRENSNVVLQHQETALEEVVISAAKMKEKVIGQKSRPFLTFSKMFDQNVRTIEQGSIFPLYQKTKLKSYNFYIIPSSKFEQITLKLNLYSIKNNIPDKSLLSEYIIFKTSATGWQNIDLSKKNLTFKGLDKIAITLQLVDYQPLTDTEFVFGISAKKSISKNLLFRYQSQENWEANDGTFISNLNIAYDKDSKEESISADQDTEFNDDVNTKILATVYKSREQAQKTSYGKSKDGKYIDLGDAKIYYEEYGKGEPLVLLHGNNGSIADFYKQIPFFSKNYRVIAIDTRGQGRSTDLTEHDYSYKEFADDLFKLIQNLKLNKVTILGWSDGGNTSLIFNYEHPEMVKKLITIGANLNPAGVEEEVINALKLQASENKAGTNLRLVNLMLNHPHISTEAIGNIKNPVLIMAGRNDVIKEEHTKLIHNAIQNSELQIIADATHYVPFEQAEKLNNLILDFLKK
ncbi:alpha/beta fold hydrolase [Pedobacter nototheniae]|uniref:alpha/beta fold hydrolase n=1 Tax=Pedobacter nototheniae TaxID=2488994 RepID=UPI00292E7448|nr:alpha/beta fold hydrolase [Pedobacter nototheniae]